MSEAAAPPDTVALMRLIMAAQAPTDVDAALDRSQAPPSLRRLWRERREAFALAKAIQAAVDHRPPGTPAAIAAAFDRAAALSAEAACALYGLGDARLTEAATREVVEDLTRRGALDVAPRILDIGCGAGRFELALAPAARRILALEASSGMAEAARRRCAGLTNVEIQHLPDGGPPALAPGSYDLALAVDSFPYIVQCGGDLAARWFAAMAQALAPGGHVCLYNFSYRGDAARDVDDVAGLAAASGLEPQALGAAPLRLWDGVVFHLRKAG